MAAIKKTYLSKRISPDATDPACSLEITIQCAGLEETKECFNTDLHRSYHAFFGYTGDDAIMAFPMTSEKPNKTNDKNTKDKEQTARLINATGKPRIHIARPIHWEWIEPDVCEAI